nr:alpha-2-macroglobulin [rats, plasma, Peptide Partial, 17 aa] [Rattus sp.]
ALGKPDYVVLVPSELYA